MQPIPSRASNTLSWSTYLCIFVIALTLRAGWGVLQWVRADGATTLEFPDEEQYWGMAGSLWRGEGLVDELGFRATRMPLYPAILAPFTDLPHGVLMARSLHWALGALAAALAAALGGLFDRRVGVVAGLLIAFDPFLIFFSSLLLTETAFIAALLALWWSVWAATRDRARPIPVRAWVVIGLLSSLCIYLRESSAGLVIIALVHSAVSSRFVRRSLVGAVGAGALVVLSLVPWAARNQHVTGDWCWLTHRGGISLYDGVRPEATGGSDLGEVKRGEAVAGLDEVAWDRHFRREAWKEIRSDPRRILSLATVKLGRMWNPVPNVATYQSPRMRLVSAAWMIPLYALTAGGIVVLAIQCREVRVTVFLLLPAVYFSALHSVFVGSVRYRLPAMPMLEILAAVFIVAAYNRWTARPGRDAMRAPNIQA